ncbi:MAG: hypothetical protein KC502_15760 [Myxococcales bacterium]|nr:hypothetical protein [Myxococcales bacterium]
MPKASAICLVACLVASLGLLASGCKEDAPRLDERPLLLKGAGKAKVVVSTRIGRSRLHPCQQCHDKVSRTQDAGGKPSHPPLPLTNKHEGLQFDHYDGIGNCYRCHSAKNMDHLELMTGVTVTLDESHRVCGQCHGEKMRDWRYGAHGKSIGSWAKTRYRMTCVDCHQPHSPAIKPVVAMPAPPFPKGGIPKTGGH